MHSFPKQAMGWDLVAVTSVAVVVVRDVAVTTTTVETTVVDTTVELIVGDVVVITVAVVVDVCDVVAVCVWVTGWMDKKLEQNGVALNNLRRSTTSTTALQTWAGGALGIGRGFAETEVARTRSADKMVERSCILSSQ